MPTQRPPVRTGVARPHHRCPRAAAVGARRRVRANPRLRPIDGARSAGMVVAGPVCKRRIQCGSVAIGAARNETAPTRAWELLRQVSGKKKRRFAQLFRALWRTRTADPLSMKKGRASSDRVCIAQSGRTVRWWVVSWAHLSIASSLGRTRPIGVRSGAHLLRDRQAARGSVAPLGAKGWLRVSMCQIASVRRRARSIWATLAPRCLPIRVLVRW